MDINIINRQQRKVVFQAAFLASFLFLIVLAYNVMNDRFQVIANEMITKNEQLYDEGRDVQKYSLRRNGKSERLKRLPDVIIVGVKKSGTITLSKFLNYHPSIAAAGEISFFEKGYFFYEANLSSPIIFIQMRNSTKGSNFIETKYQEQEMTK